MNDYPWIKMEDFDQALAEIVGELTSGTLLGIPGVYEVLSEHFNNEVLEYLEENRKAEG